MIDIFVKELINLVKMLVNAKRCKASPSPARAYFEIYRELTVVEAHSNHFLLTMHHWVERQGEEPVSILPPRYTEAYKSLKQLASSVKTFGGLLRRELELVLSVFEPGLAEKLRSIVGLKYERLLFWQAFFGDDTLIDRKELYLFTGDAKADVDNHDGFPHGHFILHLLPVLHRSETGPMNRSDVQEALRLDYGIESQVVSVNDIEAIKQILDSGWDTVALLRDTIGKLADFIRENFEIGELFERRWYYMNPKHGRPK